MSDTCEVAIDECIAFVHLTRQCNGRKATGPTARNMLLPTGTYLTYAFTYCFWQMCTIPHGRLMPSSTQPSE